MGEVAEHGDEHACRWIAVRHAAVPGCAVTSPPCTSSRVPSRGWLGHNLDVAAGPDRSPFPAHRRAEKAASRGLDETAREVLSARLFDASTARSMTARHVQEAEAQ